MDYTIIWITIAIYFLVVLGIGIFAGRGQENVTDYFAGGRSLGIIVVAFSLTATNTSGSTFIGNSGLMYENGYGPLIGMVILGGVPGMILTYLLMARPVSYIGIKYDAYTVSDILHAVFKSSAVRIASSIAIILGVFSYLVAQWVSLGVVFQSLLNTEYFVGLMIGLVIVGIYSVIGGQKGNVYNDTLQMSIMALAGILAVFYGLRATGGFTSMNEALSAADPTLVESWGGSMTIWTFISFFVLYSFGMMAQPQLLTRFFTLKKTGLLKYGLTISLVMYLLTSLFYFAGLFLRGLVEQGQADAITNPDLATPTFLVNTVPPVITGIILAAALAAIMSTASTLILTASSSIVKDIFDKTLKMEVKDRKGLRIARYFTAILIILSALIAINPPDLVGWIGVAAWGIFVASLLPAIFLGLRWRRATWQGAFASIVVGAISSIGLYIIKVTEIWVPALDTGVIALIFSLVTMIVVSYSTPNQAKEIFIEMDKQAS